eukprot:GEMP01072713.1.p1 GENE.GEMP01072713.1~~GEMP01072713.1.p1  ORF type:complete len:123 (-),score=6.06 GEMP01072713.1:775-1143(-)
MCCHCEYKLQHSSGSSAALCPHFLRPGVGSGMASQDRNMGGGHRWRTHIQRQKQYILKILRDEGGIFISWAPPSYAPRLFGSFIPYAGKKKQKKHIGPNNNKICIIAPHAKERVALVIYNMC